MELIVAINIRFLAMLVISLFVLSSDVEAWPRHGIPPCASGSYVISSLADCSDILTAGNGDTLTAN